MLQLFQVVLQASQNKVTAVTEAKQIVLYIAFECSLSAEHKAQVESHVIELEIRPRSPGKFVHIVRNSGGRETSNF